MSYFRHKLLYLKDACKKKNQATLCHILDISCFIQKMPGYREKKKVGHIMSYFRHKFLFKRCLKKIKKNKITGHVLFLKEA